ncbi:MAG TPA: GntR family transcriptional regulator [Sphingobium sp.]|nr:GntR family transcriptional regulator [Sphingobium sp.]
MEKSRRIKSQSLPAKRGNHFYAFVSGDDVAEHSIPLRAAWQIESAAGELGWRVGEALGSEGEMRGKFGVGRDALREAIRIVESRGVMQVRRGRAGGLVVAQPELERAAEAFATYHDLCGYSAEQIDRSVVALDQMLLKLAAKKPLPHRDSQTGIRKWLADACGEAVLQLYVATLGFLPHVVFDELAGSRDVLELEMAIRGAIERRDEQMLLSLASKLPPERIPVAGHDGPVKWRRRANAKIIAAKMLGKARSKSDCALGNEADLCETFNVSRGLVRQALRILADLDMLQVKRGRGGGYLIKDPSPIGIIRQSFPFLAARQSSPAELTNLMWELNSANLRAAAAGLSRLSANLRLAALHDLELLIRQSEEPERFIVLQQALSKIADCPLLDTFARCIVSYQARLTISLRFEEPTPAIQSDFQGRQLAIIDALRAGDVDVADSELRVLQDRMLELLCFLEEE